MKSRIWIISVVFCIATGGVLSLNLFSHNNKVANILLNDLEAIAQRESGEESLRRGYVDSPQACVVKEAYECRAGIRIPDWVPFVGGMQCGGTYIDEVEFPGTSNPCIPTQNMNHICDYYRCTKN